MSYWTDFIDTLQKPEFQELEGTGIACPVSGLPLLRVVRYDNEGELAYIVEKDGSVDKVYIVQKDLPYFRLVLDKSDPRSSDPRVNRWNPNHERFEESYWLLGSNGWRQYKRHTSWKLLQPVFLPIDLSEEEEVQKIIDQVGESQSPVATTWTFPLVQRVAARTIGLDLVAVQPLSAPTGILSYLDTIYGGKKPNRRRRKKNHRTGNISRGCSRVYLPKGGRRRYNQSLPFLFKKSRVERTHKRRTHHRDNR